MQHTHGYNQMILLKLSSLQLHERVVMAYHLYKYYF